MQTLKLKYLGTEIEPDPEPEVDEAAERTASEIAAQWDDAGDADAEQEDDFPEENYIFDETDTQEFTSDSDEFEV
jgi:hypothetical protein